MEHALVRGDVRMIDDPLRAQSLSLIAGCITAAIAVAACAIIAFVRPQGSIGNAPIVMARESGALYVRIGDTMHPVLNLASARLISGSQANPAPVSETAINSSKQGPLVGIPGAPATIATPLTADESRWVVCDDGSATTVIVGKTQGGFDDRGSVLVTPRAESAAITYLLYEGRRARVDLRNPAVVRALRLDSVVPRPVSRVLLDSIPEAPPIVAPRIANAGAPGPGLFTVGTVVRAQSVDDADYYVVLDDGVQRIGEVAAELIRFTQRRNGQHVADVTPAMVGTLPVVESLPVVTYPDQAGAVEASVICSQWRPGAGGGAVVSVLVGDSPRPDGASRSLAQADGDGPDIDAVSMPAGRSAFVRAVGITGAAGGALYLVNDSGVVFGLHDDDTAKVLGLQDRPVPALWPVLARLPRGPELSKDSASVVRDSLTGAT